MRPLYCFKFDDITGEITKIEIPEYRTSTNNYTGRATYTWGTPRINKSDNHFSVSQEKLNRFVNNKVFTFTDDYEYVCDIIQKDLLASIDKFERQMKQKQRLLNLYMKGRATKSLKERGLI